MKMTKYILLSLFLFSANSVTAAPAQTVAQALKKCGQVQNSLQRLVCYDNIVNELNRYGGLNDLLQVPAPLAANNAVGSQQQQPATQPQPSNAPTSSQSAENNDFGMEHKAKPDDSEDKIYATVVAITKNARKKRIFTLDNGHVWRQTESNSLSIDINEVVYIERGALGSFHLGKDQVNRRIRVKRVK